VYLNDTFSQNPYTITNTVTNTAPVFQSALTDQSVTVGHSLVYNWPTQFDAEGHSLHIGLSPTGTWFSISLISLTLNPTVTESGLS